MDQRPRTPLPQVRTGQPDVKLSRGEFNARLAERFYDPAFDAVRDQIVQIIDAAWDGYDEYRKSPRTQKAGPGFADPEYDLPIEWLEARERIRLAQIQHDDPAAPRRILLVSGAARSDQTCPGEMSKTWRLAFIAFTSSPHAIGSRSSAISFLNRAGK